MDYGDILFVVALLSIAVITVIGNILVILAVFTNRRLQNPANYLIVNLAVSDFFQGAVTMPIRGAEVLNTHNESLIRCDVVISLTILFHSASNFNLGLIALDRFIAIFKPFTYANVVKTSTYKIVVAVSWLCSLAISLCPLAGWQRSSSEQLGGKVCRYGTILTDEYIIMYVILVDLTPLTVMVITYTYIFRTTRRQISRIRAQEIAVNHAAINQAFESRRESESKCELSQNGVEIPAPDPSVAGNGAGAIQADDISDIRASNNNNRSEVNNSRKKSMTHQTSNSRQVPLSTMRTRKATRTVLAIIGFFFVLCMPISIIDAIELWGHLNVPRAVVTVALCMVSLNSCVNVFVYGGYNTDYRKAYWHVWHRMRDSFLKTTCTRTKTTVQCAQTASTIHENP